jgi:hypothetical protein
MPIYICEGHAISAVNSNRHRARRQIPHSRHLHELFIHELQTFNCDFNVS